MRPTLVFRIFCLLLLHTSGCHSSAGKFRGTHQPLQYIRLDRSALLLDEEIALIRASPRNLKLEDDQFGGTQNAYVTVSYEKYTAANAGDWIGVFSPADFKASVCEGREKPTICQAPIKYSYANFSNPDYSNTGKGSLKFRLINQRSDFAFGFFTGDLDNPVLVALSNKVAFLNPQAPGYVRLAHGKEWNEVTVTWTSGYTSEEAVPVVVWGPPNITTPASTYSYTQNDVCGPPAKTLGWRDPGFIHTSRLKDLWPNTKYYYKVGHRLKDGSYVWGKSYNFKSPPYPGQSSSQRVVIFGDMGKLETDGSNQHANYQPGCLNTTARLREDNDNFDIIFLIGDLSYSNGYLSQWDQFIEQVEPLSSRVPLMTASGNHERSWPSSGGFYNTTDSGGECGVPAQTLFNMPVERGENFCYKTDWGKFRFCVIDTEHDWRPGSKQYEFLEMCVSTVDRQKQPWLITLGHRPLGYSSGLYYGLDGSFSEPGGRELQALWQKYKVDIAFFGHIHQYERTCPVYDNTCVSEERTHFSGQFNATIHIVAGGGGSQLADFSPLQTLWSLIRDQEFGYVQLTSL